MQATAPSFFLFGPQGFVVATHLDRTLVGPDTLYPGLSHAADPNETVVLYGTGFGLPTSALVNGSASQSGVLPSLPSCRIGSTPVTVGFAGLIGPGLYQFNMTVGADAQTSEITCSYNGSSTPNGDLFTVSAH
jgi:uncharacterized protein (TIGR03437 family)